MLAKIHLLPLPKALPIDRATPATSDLNGSFVPLEQLSAGPDGVSILARNIAGQIVELRVLRRIPRGFARFQELQARLRVHAMLSHAAVREVEDLTGDEPATLVLAWPGDRSVADLIGLGPVPAADAHRIIELLGHALGAAHRLGLVHGRLAPSNVQLSDDGRPFIDLTGIDVGMSRRPSSQGSQDGQDGHVAFDALAELHAVDALQTLDAACKPPELERAGELPDARSDVYALGALLLALRLGRAPTRGERQERATIEHVVGSALAPLVVRTLSTDRDERPSAAEVVLALRDVARAAKPVAVSLASGASQPLSALGMPPVPASLASVPRRDVANESETLDGEAFAPRTEAQVAAIGPGQRLGRFHLVTRIGEGGMGEVFEGLDLSSGASVAVKVLRPELATNERLLGRFRREARTLARVKNAYVAALIEVNVDRGVHFIALELMHGPTVSEVLDRAPQHRIDELLALQIIADACRALEEPHRFEIVHRDIKPENLMFVRADQTSAQNSPLVKLCDFGIARGADPADRKETLVLTQEGMIIGTPQYMAPEQCQGRPVSPATDVYALGATLFDMLTGRCPFDGEDATQILLQHIREEAPPVDRYAPEVSDACARIVERALAKDPRDRFADAAEMLAAIDKVVRSEPTDIVAHPRLPDADAARVREISFQIDLKSSADALWPYVCNPDRLNRAVGMPPPKYETEGLSEAPEDVLTRAQNRVGGTTLKWREAPFEWVEGRRWGSYREFDSGPFSWFIADTELSPRAEGGTRLTWRIRYVPRNWVMNLAIAVEIRFKQIPVMRGVFARVDALLSGTLAKSPENDVYEPRRTPLPREADTLVQRVATDLLAAGHDPVIVEHIAALIRHGAEPDIVRVRPFEFAARYDLPREATATVLLQAAHAGLFEVGWDVLCPLCRVPSDYADSLRAIRDHAHCATCNVDYDLDFSQSIELVLRVAPTIRRVTRQRYCVGGPFLFPHVAAQVRLRPGERFVVTLGLEAGQHRLRSPQLANMLDLRISASSQRHRLDVELGGECPRRGESATLGPGEQHLVLVNALDRDMVVRIERMVQRDDALTAARVSSMAVFRELFPEQVLAAGQLVSLTQAAFLRSEIDGASTLFARLGDAKGFELVMRHVRAATAIVEANEGAIVKTIGAGLLAAFSTKESAARAALALHTTLRTHADNDAGNAQPRIRIASHAGPAMAATMNDTLDYFGQTLASLEALLTKTEPGCASLSDVLVDEPDILSAARDAGTTHVIPYARGAWALTVSNSDTPYEDLPLASE